MKLEEHREHRSDQEPASPAMWLALLGLSAFAGLVMGPTDFFKMAVVIVLLRLVWVGLRGGPQSGTGGDRRND